MGSTSRVASCGSVVPVRSAAVMRQIAPTSPIER